MRSIVVIPGRAPHWVAGHGRDVAHRLADSGRVTVAFTRPEAAPTLPGQPGGASVLGHSLSGYPVWTGRLSSALGFHRRRDVAIVVLWRGANELVALLSVIAARVRFEKVILDLAEPLTPERRAGHRLIRRAMHALAHARVDGGVHPRAGRHQRTLLALCGDDAGLARLLLRAFDSMAGDAAREWRFELLVDPRTSLAGVIANDRHGSEVIITSGRVPADAVRDADVLVAAFGTRQADIAHHATLRGGAGVLVGTSLAKRVARCPDGVWLATREVPSILVALEAAACATEQHGVPVSELHGWGDRIVDTVRAVTKEAA